jgi:hypothetical protein
VATKESPFEKKLREKKEAAARAAGTQTSGQPVAGTATPAAASAHPADHIPDLGDDLNISPEQAALDEAIKNLDIILAYNKWCGKMTPKWGSGQTESIMISCPNPEHPDKNPSAWINRTKQTYYCSGCAQGGDIWDIAAYHFGFTVPGYKNDAVQFRQLREKMGADLGFQQLKSITGRTVMVAPQQPEGEATEPAGEPEPPALLPAAAVEEAEREEREENDRNAPTIDWRNIVQAGSYLHEYLMATTIDTCPEEYHFWNGLLGLGFALGREVTLDDTEQVVANLYVCLTGPSSAGKSRSKRHLTRMLRAALPYDSNNKVSRGTKVMKAPGSAEYLISCFTSMDEVINPAGGTTSKVYYPVRGLVEFDELSQLMSTAGRVGNAIRPQLMELFDAPEVLESGSQTSGVRRAEYPFGSVISTTQNKSLRKLLDAGDDGSGFINRWIFAQGKLKKRLPMGGPMIDTSEAGKKLIQIHQWAFKGRRLPMSDEALAKWSEFFYSTVVPTQDKADEQGTAVLARMDLTMKKLFLLFAANAMESEVSGASVEQAIQLWPYLLKTFGAVNVEMRKTNNSDLQDEVLDQIRRLTTRNGKPPSRKEIYDCVKRKIGDTKELVDLLAVLVKAELVHEVPPPTGVRGRPTMRYEVA